MINGFIQTPRFQIVIYNKVKGLFLNFNIMNNEIAWYVELTLNPDMLDDFISLTNEMIKSTAQEDGVLIYERFISEDKSKIYIYERYSDSQSALSHLHNFNDKFAKRFSRLVKRVRFLIFGSPSDELKELLTRYGAVFTNQIGGFSSPAREK